MTGSDALTEGRPFAATSAARVLAARVLVIAVAPAPLSPSALLVASAATAIVVLATRSRARVAQVLPAGLGMIAATLLPTALHRGLLPATLVGGRAGLSLTIAVAGFATVPAAELAPALRALGVPVTVSAVVASALVQAKLLATEGRRLSLARQLRGRHGYGDAATLLGTLFTRAARRAQRTALAAELRGYDPATALLRARFARSDAPLLGVAGLLAGAVHVAGRLGP